MISGIILSAGLSSRFLSPKALTKIFDENVLVHLQKTLLRTQIDELIIVLGAHFHQIRPSVLNHNKIKFVYNKYYNLGQTSSFKTGLRAISEKSQGVMLFPVDYPMMHVETIQRLISYFLTHKPLILIPAFRHHKGHPPLFCTQLIKDFLALDDSKGLNTIAHKYHEETVVVEVEDPGVITSFNTQAEFEALTKKFNVR
ncbi:MAG TPA: hypothetical protein DD723_08460 [Candidatus Omnitrophica bacterium]|nr:MAG: hypothetical protein A2Z81_08405 [Omnitrophica WOR_2 bacterium GWA2_45_18]HBR15551.1 hypothetical protein [Candidatus Omnitrophota bacterium]